MGGACWKTEYMPIDRRITNGLAWAGAVLVVAVPAADFAMKQFRPATPQVAVVDTQIEPEVEDAVETSLPTPASERPAQVAVAEQPAVVTPAAPKPEAKPDPVTTATARPGTAAGNAVDDFITSGRPLPSYISGGGSGGTASSAPSQPAPQAAPAKPAAVATVPTTLAPTAPASTSTPPTPAPAAAPAVEQVATLPRTRIVTFPTPVSERPPSVARPQVAAQPPLIIDRQPTAPVQEAPLITARDLEDWESGPLSEFLARQQGGGSTRPAPDYDPNGFFLDQGPNSGARVQRFPRAYDYDYYPFE